MTPYIPTTWENEVPSETPVKYEIVGDVEGEISASATIQLITPVTAGTPVNATNLNHMEEGIENAQAAAEAAQADAASAEALAILLSTARKPVIGSVAAVGLEQISYAGTAIVSSQLTVTINLAAQSTIVAFLAATIFNDDATPNKENYLFLRIDNTEGQVAVWAKGATGSRISVPAVGVKTGVAAGNRTIDVVCRSNTNPSSFDLTGMLIVIAFRED